ncbi:hypothetical protein D3C72_1762610 [compost metagenome]
MASMGLSIVTATSPRWMAPLVSGSAPKMARATSVRPAPIRPEKPSISPRRKSKLSGPKTSLRCKSVTRSSTSAVGAETRSGNFSSRVRPTIFATMASRVVAAKSSVQTNLPSRSTVTLSMMCCISSSRCEM